MADILNFEMSSSRIHPSKRRACSCRALPSTALVLFECENTSLFIALAVQERDPGNSSIFPILTFFSSALKLLCNVLVAGVLLSNPAALKSTSCHISVTQTPKTQNLHLAVALP